MAERLAGQGWRLFAGAAAVLLGIGLAALVLFESPVPTWTAILALVIALATAAAWWVARRTGQMGLGLLLLALGLLGGSAGSLGPRHLMVAGLTPTAVAGLVCLAAGLMLLVQGSFVLVARTPGWRRLLAIPAGLLLLVFVVYPLSCAAIATNIPPTELASATPADRGLPFDEVRFKTEDGVELAGWYIPSTNRAAALVLHGAGDSTRSSVLAHGAVLARHGYGVLLLDARGHGESGGRGMDFGWYGEIDIRAALDYLAGRGDLDPDKLALVGLSMGAEQAVTAAGADSRVRAVVAEGATKRVLGDNGWLPSHPGRYVNLATDWLLFGCCRLLSGAQPPAPLKDAVAAASPRPVLFVTGEKVANEARAATYFQAVSPGSVKVWEVPGAGHTAGLATAPQEWESTVVGFLNTSLGLE